MRFFALPVMILANLVVGGDAHCNGPNAMTKHSHGSILVDASGKHSGSFINISQAVEHLPETSDDHIIFIYPGIYHEQVLIPKIKGRLVLQGYTCNKMSHTANEVTITQSTAQKDIPSSITRNRNDLTSTLRVKAHNVRVYNLNVENTAGSIAENGQALAVNVAGDKCGFYACSFLGYQDTVYANKGHQLYVKSHISGAVDFIFGAKAQAWFESCDIETVGPGAITANGRADESSSSFFVFNKARVYGFGTKSNFLGRPWRPYARVVWQNSDLDDVIHPEGWQKWNDEDKDDLLNVYFKEYKNSGPGAATDNRVSFSEQLSAPVAITEILGEDYAEEWYVDTKYLKDASVKTTKQNGLAVEDQIT